MNITYAYRTGLFSVFALGLIAVLFVVGDVHAQAPTSFQTNGIGGVGANGGGGQIMQDAEALVDNTAIRLKSIVYAGCAIGVLGLAMMAFVGRFSWVWFHSVVGGLLLIAGIQLGIEYMTGEAGVIDNGSNTAAIFQ